MIGFQAIFRSIKKIFELFVDSVDDSSLNKLQSDQVAGKRFTRSQVRFAILISFSVTSSLLVIYFIIITLEAKPWAIVPGFLSEMIATGKELIEILNAVLNKASEIANKLDSIDEALPSKVDESSKGLAQSLADLFSEFILASIVISGSFFDAILGQLVSRLQIISNTLSPHGLAGIGVFSLVASTVWVASGLIYGVSCGISSLAYVPYVTKINSSESFLKQVDVLRDVSQLVFCLPFTMLRTLFLSGGKRGGDGDGSRSSLEVIKELESLSSELQAIKENTNATMIRLARFQEESRALNESLGQSMELITSGHSTIVKQLMQGLDSDVKAIHLQTIRGIAVSTRNAKELIEIGNNLLKVLSERNLLPDEASELLEATGIHGSEATPSGSRTPAGSEVSEFPETTGIQVSGATASSSRTPVAYEVSQLPELRFFGSRGKEISQDVELTASPDILRKRFLRKLIKKETQFKTFFESLSESDKNVFIGACNKEIVQAPDALIKAVGSKEGKRCLSILNLDLSQPVGSGNDALGISASTSLVSPNE